MTEDQPRPDTPPSDVEAPGRLPQEWFILLRQGGRRGAGSGLFMFGAGVGLTALLALAGGVLYTSKKQAPPPAKAVLPAKPAALSIEAAAASRPTLPVSSENFAYHVEGVPGDYQYQLDGRENWRVLTDPAGVPIQISDGDRIAFFGSDAVCALSAPCTGPEGQGTAARLAELAPLDFPAPDAHFQALVARIGELTFEVGRQKLYIVPQGTGAQPVKLMANIRLPELASTKYGYRVRVRIQRGR